jgi:hypothetical protein
MRLDRQVEFRPEQIRGLVPAEPGFSGTALDIGNGL